jgi:hypothetical protein
LIRQRLPQKETLDKAQPRDNFSTPNYATELLVPFIPENIKYIWEPACGDGKISNVLVSHNYSVFSTDIKYGDNFLTKDFTDYTMASKNIAIITNPPYSLKIKFFRKCVEYNLPFALLISADYAQWNIEAITKYSCEKIIPTARIDFITPAGLSGATGHTAYFHSYWLTRYFNLGKSETFVELTKKMKENI